MHVEMFVVYLVLSIYGLNYSFVGYVIDALVNPDMNFLLRVWYILFWPIPCAWWIARWTWKEQIYQRYLVWQRRKIA